MATDHDFSRSSLLTEQYQRDMELIAIALQEESQDEREERLGLVAQAWPLTAACFQSQQESEISNNGSLTYEPVVLARP